MILEGLVTTLNADQSVHLRPMGPVFSDPQGDAFQLRPYEPSGTLDNLRRSGQGVLHVTDDVLLIARAALRQLQAVPPTSPALHVQGCILADCCHWLEFEVVDYLPGSPRHEFRCRVVHRGRHRDFWGFNRARHAVLEATILATRVGILPDDEIRTAMQSLWSPVEKTAGHQEREAWNLVRTNLVESLGEADLPPGFSLPPHSEVAKSEATLDVSVDELDNTNADLRKLP